MRVTHISLISAVLILAAGAAVGQTLRFQRDDRGGGMSFRFDRGDRRGDVGANEQTAKSTRALRRCRLTAIGVSSAALEARRGSPIPSPTFAGVDMFRDARWRKSSATGRTNCSGVSTGSETSTMTGGRAELGRLDNRLALSASKLVRRETI